VSSVSEISVNVPRAGLKLLSGRSYGPVDPLTENVCVSVDKAALATP